MSRPGVFAPNPAEDSVSGTTPKNNMTDAEGRIGKVKVLGTFMPYPVRRDLRIVDLHFLPGISSSVLGSCCPC